MPKATKLTRTDLGQLHPPAVYGGTGTSIPFTRSSTMLPFIDFLDTIGAPTERLLHQAGIPAALLEHPETLVPLHSAHRFGELASRSERIEDLGLVVAQRTSAFDLGVLGRSLRDAATVYEYLHTGIRLIGSVSGGERFWLSFEDDRLRFNQFMPGFAGPGRCQADVYTLVVTVNMLRSFIDPCWYPDEVRLLAGDEKLLGERMTFGNARIILGQPYSSFTMARSLLQCPVQRGHNTGRRTGDTPPVNDPPMPEGLKSSVEQYIVTLLADGCPDIHLTAEAAGMSTRTLQRRLAEIGLTFSQLVKDGRMRLAAEWLADTDMPIAHIATSLGYTDASNFARAFRRQTGTSPLTYRRAGTGNR